MKVSDLDGAALDRWAASANGDRLPWFRVRWPERPWFTRNRPYSSEWEYGGPLIERERIDLDYSEEWRAGCGPTTLGYGATPLIAAMRCFVASKFGDEVPDA